MGFSMTKRSFGYVKKIASQKALALACQMFVFSWPGQAMTQDTSRRVFLLAKQIFSKFNYKPAEIL